MLSFRPSQSRFRNSKSMLIKLTRFTIETGLITTIAAIVELIIGILYKDLIAHVAVFYTLSKLYSNCLLASLNFRLVLRNPQNMNLTEIVQNDLASNPSRRWDTQSGHVVRSYPGAESVMDITADPHESQLGLGRSGSIEDHVCEVHELRDLSTRVSTMEACWQGVRDKFVGLGRAGFFFWLSPLNFRLAKPAGSGRGCYVL